MVMCILDCAAAAVLAPTQRIVHTAAGLQERPTGMAQAAGSQQPFIRVHEAFNEKNLLLHSSMI